MEQLPKDCIGESKRGPTRSKEKATPQELRGEAIFFGKGECSSCHTGPYYSDNVMHNLHVERFYKWRTINGVMSSADGPIKTFPLRGIKDTPPYLHDERINSKRVWHPSSLVLSPNVYTL